MPSSIAAISSTVSGSTNASPEPGAARYQDKMHRRIVPPRTMANPASKVALSAADCQALKPAQIPSTAPTAAAPNSPFIGAALRTFGPSAT